MGTEKHIKQIANRIRPSQFLNCRDYLQAIYESLKQKEKFYSYRQLSEDLGFARTNMLHLIVQGKRPITNTASAKMIDALGLRKRERQYFLALVKISQAKSGEETREAVQEAISIRSSMLANAIEKDQFAYYSEWWHAVIREMVAIEDFEADGKWIASKVWPRISVREAEDSLELLKKLNLIFYDKSKEKWVQTNTTVTTGSEVFDISVTGYHNASIPQGVEALANIPQADRHVSSLTLCVNQSQFEQLKNEIQAFQEKLLQLEQDESFGQPDRVVQINMQLFPSTKSRG